MTNIWKFYEYDAEGNRVAQIDQITGARTEYVIDESSNVLTATEIDNGNRFVTTYVYGDGLISQKSSKNGYLTFHYNNIGSTMMLTDENGNVNEEYSYRSYGELLSGDASKTAYLYNGQYGVATDANGLYYMRTRYYNVSIKRFINQDAVIGTIDNSKSLNKFAYVQGNPISLNDPFGLWMKLPKLKLPKKWSKAAHTALDIGGLFFDGCDVASEAKSQIAKKADGVHPATCKGNGQCFVAGTINKTKDGEKNIEDVEAGDEILTSEGQKISIEKIEIEVLAEPVYVYNFTVEDFHTYFVSELGVWVHNTCLVSKTSYGKSSEKYMIHEVTDAKGYIIHRDFEAVRISSGQIINKGH